MTSAKATAVAPVINFLVEKHNIPALVLKEAKTAFVTDIQPADKHWSLHQSFLDLVAAISLKMMSPPIVPGQVTPPFIKSGYRLITDLAVILNPALTYLMLLYVISPCSQAYEGLVTVFTVVFKVVLRKKVSFNHFELHLGPADLLNPMRFIMNLSA